MRHISANHRLGSSIAKVSLSLALIAFAFLLVDEPGKVLEQISQADVRPLVGALLVFLIGQCFFAERLRQVLSFLRRPVSYPIVLRAHLIGVWFNSSLPTSVGGEAVKALLLHRHGGLFRVVRAVIVNRATGLLALLAVVVLTTPLAKEVYGSSNWGFAYQLAGLSAFFLLGAFLAISLAPKVRVLTRGRSSRLFRFGLLLLLDVNRLARSSYLLGQITTSVVILVTVIACFFLISISLGGPSEVVLFCVVVPPIILAMHIPISFGGWGVREVSAVALFYMAGVSNEVALSISIVYGAVILVTGFPGILLWNYPFRASAKPSAPTRPRLVSESGGPRLSIVIPLYNEVESIPYMRTELSRALGEIDTEVIVVDDGSTDSSSERLHDDSFFRIVRITHAGKTSALRTGIEIARAPVICTIDADMQENPDCVLTGLKEIEDGADMVIGVRADRQDELFSKCLPSRIYRLLIFGFFGTWFSDINCGLRVFKKEVADAFSWFEGAHRLFPLFALRRGAVVVEIPVKHQKRRFGISKFASPSRFGEAIYHLMRIRIRGV